VNDHINIQRLGFISPSFPAWDWSGSLSAPIIQSQHFDQYLISVRYFSSSPKKLQTVWVPEAPEDHTENFMYNVKIFKIKQ